MKMGALASLENYDDPEEAVFQAGIRQTPWFSEYQAKYGETPDLETPDYNYREAWKAGARPTVRDPGDQLLHWPSQFKGDNHPNRYIDGVDTRTGQKMGALAADDPWARYNQPFGEMRGTSPEDTPTVFKTRGGVKITEGDIQRGIDVGMGAATVGGPAKGIKAYHSSPHDFDKFDLAKIGTGEGAQVYGHGLYFAENPAVSGQGGQYWEQFLPRTKDFYERDAAKQLKEYGFDRSAAVQGLDATIERLMMKKGTSGLSTYEHELLPDLYKRRDLLASDKQIGPRTYEVNINADPAQMLDWDKPIPTKHAVREMIADKALVNTGSVYADVRNAGKDAFLSAQRPELTGEGAYRSLVRASLDKPRGEAVPYVSSMLKEAGIPGIKYLDQGSRAVPTKIQWAKDALANPRIPDVHDKAREVLAKWEATPVSSNYVVFDDKLIDIMRKYGLAGAAPAGMGALAAQDYYGAER